MDFTFNKEFIQNDIVKENYTDIAAFREALKGKKFETVSKDEVNNALVIPESELDRTRDKAEGNGSIILDADRTKSTIQTFVNGQQLGSQGNEWQENYKGYRQEHCQPFCHAISRGNNRLSRDSLILAPGLVPPRLQLKPQANAIRIFKKIGEKYYYITIEQKIEIVQEDIETEAHSTHHKITFEVMTIFESAGDQMVLVDMFVPEGCANIAQELLTDSKKIAMKNSEVIEDPHVLKLEVFKKKLEELKAKKPFNNNVQDKQKLAVYSALESKQNATVDELEKYISLIDESLAIHADSTPKDYLKIARSILEINQDATESPSYTLLNKIDPQIDSLKITQDTTDDEILNYHNLIVEIKNSANVIYIGAGYELSRVIEKFILKDLNPQKKALYHFFNAREALNFSKDTAVESYQDICDAVNNIAYKDLNEDQINLLSQVIDETHALQVHIANISKDDLVRYKNLAKIVNGSFVESALYSAMEKYEVSLAEAAKNTAANNLKRSSEHSTQPSKEIDVAAKTIAVSISSENKSLKEIGYDFCDIQLKQNDGSEQKGWVEHRGENDTYIIKETDYKYYPATQPLPTGDYRANHVFGLALTLKQNLDNDKPSGISVTVKFSRVFDERSNRLYVVERDIVFKNQEGYLAHVPYHVIHAYERQSSHWTSLGIYVAEKNKKHLNDLFKQTSATLQPMFFIGKLATSDEPVEDIKSNGFTAFNIDVSKIDTSNNTTRNSTVQHGRGNNDVLFVEPNEVIYVSVTENIPDCSFSKLETGSILDLTTIELWNRLNRIPDGNWVNSDLTLNVNANRLTSIFKEKNGKKYCIVIESELSIIQKKYDEEHETEVYCLPDDLKVIHVYEYEDDKENWKCEDNCRFVTKQHLQLIKDINADLSLVLERKKFDLMLSEFQQNNPEQYNNLKPIINDLHPEKLTLDDYRFIKDINADLSFVLERKRFDLMLSKFQQNNLEQYNNLKTIINDLDPEKLTLDDYRLLTKTIDTVTNPKTSVIQINQLILELMQSGIGCKTKKYYDPISYNRWATALCVFSGISVIGFLLIACAPLILPELAIISLEYCITGMIATGITGLAGRSHLKTWSPLYDAMTTISELPNNNLNYSQDNNDKSSLSK